MRALDALAHQITQLGDIQRLVEAHVVGLLEKLEGARGERGEGELATEIAMQVAATNPKYLNPEEVPTKEVEKEKDIYRQELAEQGKPAEIIEKIIEGKIGKYFEEICLIKQEYIKDDKKKIEDILGEAKVDKYIRYSL